MGYKRLPCSSMEVSPASKRRLCCERDSSKGAAHDAKLARASCDVCLEPAAASARDGGGDGGGSSSNVRLGACGHVMCGSCAAAWCGRAAARRGALIQLRCPLPACGRPVPQRQAKQLLADAAAAARGGGSNGGICSISSGISSDDAADDACGGADASLAGRGASPNGWPAAAGSGGAAPRDPCSHNWAAACLPEAACFACPYPDCGALCELPVEAPLPDAPPAACPACGRWVCPCCRCMWHAGLRCSQYQALGAGSGGGGTGGTGGGGGERKCRVVWRRAATGSGGGGSGGRQHPQQAPRRDQQQQQQPQQQHPALMLQPQPPFACAPTPMSP